MTFWNLLVVCTMIYLLVVGTMIYLIGVGTMIYYPLGIDHCAHD